MLGFVLAYLYSKTSNVWYPIALHMAINFLGSVVPMLLADKIARYEEIATIVANGEELTAELTAELAAITPFVLGYSLLTVGMAIAGLVIFFRRRRQIFVSDRCEILIPKERRTNVILANVGVISFLILSGILMFLSIFAG